MAAMPAALPGDRRTVRPIWRWALICGLILATFGVIALATPGGDPNDFVVDGLMMSAMSLALGALTIAQVVGMARAHTPGWPALLIAGVHGLAAGVAFAVLVPVGSPVALIWSLAGFLAVQGGIVLIGLCRAPALRMWGVLLGVCLLVASAGVVLALLVAGEQTYELLDLAIGLAALFSGIGLIVAAALARAETFRERD